MWFSRALESGHEVMREPCFNELRTQQQLGYIVSSSLDVDYAGNKRVEGLLITVVFGNTAPAICSLRLDIEVHWPRESEHFRGPAKVKAVQSAGDTRAS